MSGYYGQPMIIQEGGGGGSHIGAIILGLVALLVIAGITVAIFYFSKTKASKADKFNKGKKKGKGGKGGK